MCVGEGGCCCSVSCGTGRKCVVLGWVAIEVQLSLRCVVLRLDGEGYCSAEVEVCGGRVGWQGVGAGLSLRCG